MNLQGDEEGFEQYGLQIVHMERELVHIPCKAQGANELIGQRTRNTTNCIFTAISLVAYPAALELPFNEKTVVKQPSDQRCKVSAQPMQTLQDHFYDRRFQYRCIYNKLQLKVDFKHQMASIYRNLDYHLDYTPQNYRTFTDRDAPLGSDLEFSSNFESGNLLLAYWCPFSQSYYLVLHHDINSHGYSQWFYFRVRNREKCRVRFKVCNLIKPLRHFVRGMRPSVYSMEQKRLCNRNWFKGGEGVEFYRNNMMRRGGGDTRSYYSLEFAYSFQYANDNVYFAMNVPYTYTQLMKHLTILEMQDRPETVVIKHRSLTYTVSNNDVQLVEIYKEHKLPKKAVLVLARQHPCETVSSFVAQAMMRFLVSNDPIASQLLDQYRFFLIPMVNPDGVVHGNSRVNLLGVDINRQWLDINKNLSIETFAVTNFLNKLCADYRVEYMFDLHGHSKKLNTFGYFSDNKLQTKSFAYYLSELSNNFSFESCTFGISEDKEKTFRSLAYSLGVINPITIQNSYFGRTHGNTVHCFTHQDFIEIGVSLLKAVHKFTTERGVDERVQAFVRVQKTRQVNKEYSKENSDSDPEADYLNQVERETIVRKPQLEPEQKEMAKSTQVIRSDSMKKPQLNQTMFVIKNQKLRQTKTRIPKKTAQNFRYSSMRHRTEPDEQTEGDLMIREVFVRPMTTQKLAKPSSFSNSSFPFRTLRPQSEVLEKKYSANKVLQYPTSIHPYFSHFVAEKLDKSEKERCESRNSTSIKKDTSSPSKYLKQAESMLPFSGFIRQNPNRLTKLQTSEKTRKNPAKRGVNAYALLRQIINISSYNN